MYIVCLYDIQIHNFSVYLYLTILSANMVASISYVNQPIESDNESSEYKDPDMN